MKTGEESLDEEQYRTTRDLILKKRRDKHTPECKNKRKVLRKDRVFQCECFDTRPAASPTPWKVWPPDTNGITTDRSDAKTHCVARTVECMDARFIVRAVNAHEELVTIAKAYRNLLRAASTDGEVATFHHIEDVLEKAEGK